MGAADVAPRPAARRLAGTAPFLDFHGLFAKTKRIKQ
jgi:hypothetical protein